MNIVITGASKGLGKALAEKFASAGHSLFICARNEVHLYKMMEEILTKYAHASIKAIPADLSKKTGVTEFAIWVLQNTSSIDILVNNAGQFLPGSVFNEEEGLLEKMMEVNLYSAYHLTRTLLPKMMEAKSGHIFNMCSIGSFQAYANGGAYSISKFALAGFSKNLREEMKPYNIKVTTVYSGAAYTDSWKESGINPLRMMKEDDVAGMIYAASLLSPQACVEEILLRPQLGDL